MIKNAVLALSLAISLGSCKTETQKEHYAILKGEVANFSNEAKGFTVESYKGFEDSISVDANNQFVDSLQLETGLYQLYLGNLSTSVYLEEGKAVSFKADQENKEHPFVFSGDYAALNNYYVEKSVLESAYWDSIYENIFTEEATFQEEQTKIQENLKEQLTAIENLPEGLKNKELHALNYLYLDRKLYYKNTMTEYAEDDEIQISEDFKSQLDEELSAVDLNNFEDYDYSSEFRNLVLNLIYEDASAIQKEEGIAIDEAMLNVLSTISNEEVKEDLLYFCLSNFPSNKEALDQFLALSENEKRNKEVKEKYQEHLKLAKGSPSPVFENYENFSGGVSSLADFKGKYIYIDVWATWCAPCKAEIPFLKELEEAYSDKNIQFVSISADTPKDHDKWKKMVKDQELGGVQLITDNGFDTPFINDYLINGIPRFILIDPQGDIVVSDAPRPSDAEGMELLFKSINL